MAGAKKAQDQIQTTTVHLMKTNLRIESPLGTPLPGTPLPTPLPTPARTGSNNPFLNSAFDEAAEEALDGLGWDWDGDDEVLPTLPPAPDTSDVTLLDQQFDRVMDATGNRYTDSNVRTNICTLF